MVKLAHLIPLFPLAAFLVNILFGQRLGKISALVSIGASLVSFIFSIITLFAYYQGQGSYSLAAWLSFGTTSLKIGVLVDPLTCSMLLVVTLIGTLIQIYSIGYMEKDPRFPRFFAYLSLFSCSMLGLLLADNFLLLYIFWEGVGVCSYLLISFWFEKPAAAKAGLKAFITTRIGDTGFLLGIFIFFITSGSLSFAFLSEVTMSQNIYGLAALLIFCGAIGKSAQFPLHVWLPDAMEGPTPVSALIHAATMVAAGVYLVARCFALFAIHTEALLCVAYVGAITAVMAASIAVVNNDIKRILAYSTISQLGLMMLGLGSGSYAGGTFHLVTHAFFKALLFLCAGSVIHSVHTQDISKMGGLWRSMKITGTTFIIGALAIAGIPPLAGFWSKDEILSHLYHSNHPVLFAAAVLTSFLTAFYMFRLIFLVLLGKPRSELHGHESPKVMTWPLIVLAIGSVIAGLPGSPFFHHAFQNFIQKSLSFSEHALTMGPDYFIMGLSTLLGLLGVAGAYIVYGLNNKILPSNVQKVFRPLYTLVANKYYIDEIYEFIFIKPCRGLSQRLADFDLRVIDGLVNRSAWLTVWSSRVKAWFDQVAVDGLVNLTAQSFGVLSKIFRRTQTGHIQTYLLIAFLSFVFIILSKWIGG